jgi:hypothetical protein
MVTKPCSGDGDGHGHKATSDDAAVSDEPHGRQTLPLFEALLEYFTTEWSTCGEAAGLSTLTNPFVLCFCPFLTGFLQERIQNGVDCELFWCLLVSMVWLPCFITCFIP